MTFATLLWFAVGLVLLVVGADVLVRGASRLAYTFGISPLVVGLTVVAFGTSAPELAVSIQSAYSNQAGIALGNVIGSNIFNILFILGISAAITPLTVAAQLIRLDVPLLIGASILTLIFAANGLISRTEGAILFACILAYIIFLIRQSRRESAASRAADSHNSGKMDETIIPTTTSAWQNLIFVLVGLMLLVLGARWLVQAAVSMAQALGISDLIVGLTIVAAGTSLPEVATSIVAALRGERDIAVGNVVGSNLFNLLVVLGLSALVAPAGIPVPTSALAFDLPVMGIVAVACLPIFFTGGRVARWEGLLFLGYYVAYTVYLVLQSTHSDAAELFNTAMLYFVMPLTLLTLVVTLWRDIQVHRA